MIVDDAVARLDAALSDTLLFNLLNRRYFELLMLEEIGEREPVPWAMARAAIAAFRWDEHWTDLPPDYQYLTDRLFPVPLAEERLARLRQDARRIFIRDCRKSAARLLLGPYRPHLFNVTAGADMMEAMGELLNELRTEYPAILQREVGPRVLDWWTEATANPAARINKRTTRITWTILGLSFLAGLLQALIRNS